METIFTEIQRHRRWIQSVAEERNYTCKLARHLLRDLPNELSDILLVLGDRRPEKPSSTSALCQYNGYVLYLTPSRG
jgi:hypothetical protein